LELEMLARWVFWLCLMLLTHTYAGYVAWLWIASRFWKVPLEVHPHVPSVTVMIAVRDEENALPHRLASLRRLDYESSLLQIIIASDGSSDGTPKILVGNSDLIVPLILQNQQGKAAALNEAARLATGDILVFFDVRQEIDSDAILQLVQPFSDLTVGAVSGSLVIEEKDEERTGALGAYWQWEKRIRALESDSGSMIGTTGAIYAMRRELYTPMPLGTILDDVFLPMHVALRGKRVIFQPRAIVRDAFSTRKGTEFSRRVRTLTGNFQLVRIAPWLVSPRNPLLFRFVSHKLLRLVSPFLMLVIFVASAYSDAWFYKAVLGLQVLLYLCFGLSVIVPRAKKLRLIALIHTFIVLNLAALVAFLRFVTGRLSLWRERL
jgi:poly-beta-1,6-N-acetyl-D-glucosamine synthase